MVPVKTDRCRAIERSVIAALRHVHRDYLRLGRRSGKWTRAIKNAVGRVAMKYRSRTYAAQCAFGENGEWMFDLIWSREDEKYLYRVPLAMESEWDAKDILWDFSKLVAARVDHRVMVFWGKAADDARATLSRMLRQISCFQGSAVGDRYLFCWWTEQPDRFWWELYVVKQRPYYRPQRSHSRVTSGAEDAHGPRRAASC